MLDDDKAKIIDRYRTRYETMGAVPAALGEPKERQTYYYHFLFDTPAFSACKSLLDVGCGFADLSAYLTSQGWQGEYSGIDIVPEFVAEAQRRFPGIDVREWDLERTPLERRYDWAVAISVLTGRPAQGSYLDYLEAMMTRMWEHVDVGMSFNLYHPYVDFRTEVHGYPSYDDVVGLVRKLSRRYVIRNDFMPFETAVYLLKDNAVDKELSIFSAHRSLFEELPRITAPSDSKA